MALPGTDLPRKHGIYIPLPPPVVAKARTVNNSLTSSTAVDVTLNASTTFLEVHAIDAGIFMRYQASATSSNFDEYIAAGTLRHYVKPQAATVVSFIADTSTAKLRFIEK